MRGTSTLPAPVGALTAAVRHLLVRGSSLTAGALVAAGRGTAFWAAIVVPVAYVPRLFGGSGTVELHVLLGYIGLHALALSAGYLHDGVLGQFDRSG